MRRLYPRPDDDDDDDDDGGGDDGVNRGSVFATPHTSLFHLFLCKRLVRFHALWRTFVGSRMGRGGGGDGGEGEAEGRRGRMARVAEVRVARRERSGGEHEDEVGRVRNSESMRKYSCYQ